MPLRLRAAVAASAIILSACAPTRSAEVAKDEKAPGAPEGQLLYSVEDARITRDGETVILVAQGFANSGGWHNVHLHVREGGRAQACGLVMQLRGTPPEGAATAVMDPIEARTVLQGDLPDRIVIEAKTNAVTVNTSVQTPSP